jgi:hypothetical protein
VTPAVRIARESNPALGRDSLSVVATTPLALEPKTPWTIRLFQRIPLPTLATAVVFGLASLGAFCVVSAVFGAGVGRFAEFAEARAVGPELLLGLLIGLAPALTVTSARGALRDLEDLRPTLRCSDEEYTTLRGALLRYPRWLLTAAGLVAAFGAAAFVLLDPDLWKAGARPPLTRAAFLWLLVRNVVNFWLLSRALAFELVSAQAFSQLGERLDADELLNRASLAPFGRRAHRGVLLWMSLVAFYSLLFVGGWAADPATWVLIGIAVFAFTAFLLPMLGAHRRLRAVKRAESKRVRAAVAALQPKLLTPGSRGELARGHVADLIAWESRVESLREWPLSTPTVLRFALYVSLGLGSWVGAALVERLLESSLR